MADTVISSASVIFGVVPAFGRHRVSWGDAFNSSSISRPGPWRRPEVCLGTAGAPQNASRSTTARIVTRSGMGRGLFDGCDVGDDVWLPAVLAALSGVDGEDPGVG